LPEYVDFHLHTNHSDGSDSPTRVVERAQEAKLKAIAITDHDTVSGIAEAIEVGEQLGIQILSGVEVSSIWNGRELHILGLGVDIDSVEFLSHMQEQTDHRNSRAEKIIKKLNGLGVPAEREKIAARTADGVIGRMHIAQEIVALGHASTVQGAFDKFIKKGKRAFIPKKAASPKTAVEWIHAAGGLAFIAHPGLGNVHASLDKLLTIPFDGIEVYHSRHSAGMSDALSQIVEDKGLLATGGSDCHGDVKGEAPLMGKVQVPYRIMEAISDRLSA